MAMYKKDQEKVIPTGKKQQQVPEKKETGDWFGSNEGIAID